MYYSNSGDGRISGKINVSFSPDAENPSFKIYDAHLIDESDRAIILKYIMQSEYYDQDIYGRTLDSMLIEWAAHTDYYNDKRSSVIDKITGANTREQAKDVDFDRDSEGLPYIGFFVDALVRKIKSYWE
jgi:hypothetical protein